MASVKLETVPWTTPNFVSIKIGVRPREEGFIEGPKLPLHEVDADTLALMCDEFRADIFEKAGKSDPAPPEAHQP